MTLDRGSRKMSKSAAVTRETPRFEDGKAMLVAGLAERHCGTNTGIPAQWQRFAPHIGRVPGQVGRTAYGVVFDSLKDVHSFGYLAGVEVSDLRGLPGGFGHMEIPAQRYAVFPHHRHVSALAGTIDAICKDWFPSSGYRHASDGVDLFERYSEAFDPQTGTGGIETWIPIVG
ncbi:MAG: hypothetical protein GEU91_01100 [Rhizobiales bacterium]|nr:hypothetical protein [Hyphomicrobiales bacterium]